MIHIEEMGLAYMAVPKAACSSVKAALATLDPTQKSSDSKNISVDQAHEMYPTRRFRPHLWQQTTGAYRFTVVRDPIKRLFSAYSDRVVRRNELKHSPKLRAQSALPLDPDPDAFFSNLAQYQEMSSVIKHHTVGMWLFTGRDLDAYDRVFTTAELSKLASELTRRTKKTVEMPKANSSKNALQISDLSADAQAQLRRATRNDFDVFGKLFEDPFA